MCEVGNPVRVGISGQYNGVANFIVVNMIEDSVAVSTVAIPCILGKVVLLLGEGVGDNCTHDVN